MKKVKLKTSIFSVLSCLLLFFPAPKTELKDIAKPYLGVYECQQVRLSNRDLADCFSYIRLELNDDGTFLLRYAKKEGKERVEKGSYTYDKESQTLRLKGKGIEREFPLKDGVITMHIVFGRKNLIMQFKQK